VNVISFSDFKKSSKEEIARLMPIRITFDGEPLGIFGQEDKFIYIGDMHPRVQTQMKAKEQLVRTGMPKDTTVEKTKSDVRE
jgi:hypothetical protein